MDAFLGEIRMFTGTFAPEGWLYCDGQTLPLNQYQALYSLIGTAFGGNGSTNFCLPDFRSRVPIHRGQGTGLSQYNIGQQIGTETTVLTVGQIPAHTHNINAASAIASIGAASGSVIASSAAPAVNFVPGPGNPDVTLSGKTVSVTGQTHPHNNIQPSLVVAFIICTAGQYPTKPS